MTTRQHIKCLIIEDEPLAQDLLMDYVERTPALLLVGTAVNGQQAILQCEKSEPDLLLLDIRMPRMSGFELLDRLPKPVPLVVVTTAYREYALKGYEHAVVDFLEKPIFFDRFTQAILRVEERLNCSQLNGKNPLSGEVESRINHKVLTIRAERNMVNILLDNINFIESLDNYAKIHQLDQPAKAVLSKVTISHLDSQLPDQHFVRINRKYIVRIDQVHRATSSFIELYSGDSLPIGVTFRDSVRNALGGAGLL